MAATGGVGQLFFMYPSGGQPEQGYENIVKYGYHLIVGYPVLTPRWPLGWHQCRYGYKDLDQVKEVVKNYSDNGIALDTIWNDIDYMNDYQDFTYDPVAFKDLGEFVQHLHDETNQRYVPILDAGIAKRDGQGYKAYDEGVKADVFVKAYDGLD